MSVPVAFFLTAPLALVAGGSALCWLGAGLLMSHTFPATAAATHLGSLGLLAVVMIGALYQMVPVVAGARVPWVRSGHLVHGLLVVGLALFVAGLSRAERPLLWGATALLAAAVVLFLIPVALSLTRAPSRTDTVQGMKLSLLGFAAVSALGLWLLASHANALPPSTRLRWIPIHVTLGLVVWVGGLLVSVSWEVLPMFYLAPPVYPEIRRRTLWALAVTGVAVPVMIACGLPAWVLAAAPGTLAVWFVHPLASFVTLARRRRSQSDPSLRFWRTGLTLAPLVLLAAIAAVWFSDPRLPLLFGWLAIWGWAGIILHGMLTRIVPFLIWFHRFAPLAGRVPIPSMRRLLPEPIANTGYVLHLTALVAGMLAIGFRSDALARLTGVALAATGAALAVSLIVPLRHPVPEAPSNALET
ncbi:MAG: hypothetical protein R3E12_13880 [Candidatus Eisenbacteria bacterium]